MEDTLSNFCGSKFWDLNRTWYTNDPDLTPCFEDTVLVWLPCGFLWIFAVLDIHYSRHSHTRSIPWSPLNVTKSVITILLILVELYQLGFAIMVIMSLTGSGSQSDLTTVPPVMIVTPIIKILTFAIYTFLLHFSIRHGIQSSAVQFIFWFLLTICAAPAFRTHFRNNSITMSSALVIARLISFPLICGNFLLNCWADMRPEYEQTPNSSEKPCPEHSSSFLNRLFFSWLDTIVWKGFRQPLELKHLCDLNPEDTSRIIVPKFNAYWAPPKESEPMDSNSVGKIENGKIMEKEEKKPIEKNIIPALFRAFGGDFMLGASLKLVPDLLTFASPQLLSLLINFVKDDKAEEWKGYLFALLLFATAFCQTIFQAQHYHLMLMTGLRVQSALQSAVYRKALVISNATRMASSVGEIVNLMSVDVSRVMEAITFLNFGWSSILQISVATYFLYAELGPSVFSGIAVMIAIIPINSVIMIKVQRLQVIQMKNKDARVKLMNEILAGVKVLKLYAWEPSFQNQVLKIRERELATLRSAAWLDAITNFLWTCAPSLVALMSFATFVLIDEENVLSPEKAFVSISLFNIMANPLTVLPMTIMRCVQARVSIVRLNKFMNTEELSQDAVGHDDAEEDAIVIKNGTFGWDPDMAVLKNINLRIPEGSLTAIVGTVGSGKSSLLAAMLGELQLVTKDKRKGGGGREIGRVNTKGKIAYVAQQAWIQNDTVKNNILFGQPFEGYKYDRIIQTCALQPDLDILPGGDQTEIGEKGINLSGGQKQRVSVARAAYNNADIYLLDDPLSALDSHVGKHIFERVLGPQGLLRGKTRVLVTHGISFLPQMDQIIVVKDGEISEFGSYQSLLDKKGAFSEFLTQHQAVGTENGADESEKENVTRQNSSKLGRQLSSSLSTGSGTKDGDKMVAVTKNEVGTKLIETEKRETESVKLSVYFDYTKAAGWPMVFGTFFFYFLFQVFAVGSNMWLSAWTNEPPILITNDNNVTIATIDSGKRDLYLGVYGSLGFFQALSVFAGSLLMALATLRSSSRFHFLMLRSILRAPMSFFDTTPVGRIVNRFARDIDMTDLYLPFNIRLFLNNFYNIMGTIFVIAYSMPVIMVIIPVVGVLYYIIQKFYISTSRQLKRLESVTRSPIYSHFSETLSGAATIRAFKEEDRFIHEAEVKVDQNQVTYFLSTVVRRWQSVRLETVGNLIIFFAALFAVIGRQTLSPGLVGLSVSYALQITFSLNMLVRWLSEVETNIVAVERMIEYVDAPQEAEWEVFGTKPPKSWPQEGTLQFQNYETRYREGLDLVLKDFSCTINGGEKIGIVGRTGAGKSSLTLALFRIIEGTGQGSIRIDGHDIAKLGLHDVRGRLTIIPQDPVLFSGSLRMNLDPFETYSDDTIWHALELAHLKSYAETLAGGLNFEVAENGENLSVGQRQLICLARALLRKTKVLVLDEATAAVDLDTDDLIQQTIRQEFKDSTVITIAHRLNTIMDSTRVMVLAGGEIREFDTPENLLGNKNSLFYNMARDAGVI